MQYRCAACLTCQEFVLYFLFVLAWMLAHNILYTYIAPFLALSGLEDRADTVLLVFGAAALAFIWLTGILIDRYLRLLVQISLIGFVLIAAAFWIAGTSQAVIFAGTALWGLAFGGKATLLQTTLADASGEEAVDTVMPLNTTVWNLAIALGGIVGGLAMEQFGAQIFPAALLILSLCALVVVSFARKYSFPANKTVAMSRCQRPLPNIRRAAVFGIFFFYAQGRYEYQPAGMISFSRSSSSRMIMSASWMEFTSGSVNIALLNLA